MFVYQVQPGDTLYLIARRYNTTIQKILELNNIADPDMLDVGMKLNIDNQTVSNNPPVGEENDPSSTRLIDRILYTITTDRATYSQGQTVRLTLTKVNLSSSPITLNYRTSQRFDFAAFRGGAGSMALVG